MKLKLATGLGALTLLATTLVASPAAAYEVVDVADGGAIAGTVKFLGAAPAPVKLEPTKDKAFCGKTELTSEQMLVGPGGGLQNVVVFLDKVKKGRAATPSKPRLDNKACRYEPHVQAFTINSELTVSNQDPVLHNTHIKLPDSDVFNYGLPVKGQTVSQKIRRPGLMKVGCDAGHTWMSAYIAVFDHPYFAVTGPDGGFSLEGVPSGTYKVVFWHEKLGRKVKKVTVTAGGSAPASLDWK